MDSLPVEIKVAMYTRLHDVPSLRSLNLTSTSFHHSFLAYESFIVLNVFQNECDLTFLREVLAVLRASQMKLSFKDMVKQITHLYFATEPSFDLIHWNMSTALRFSHLLKLIQAFTVEFASAALPIHPKTNKHERFPRLPTAAELRRFERSFWRFEFCCTIF